MKSIFSINSVPLYPALFVLIISSPSFPRFPSFSVIHSLFTHYVLFRFLNQSPDTNPPCWVSIITSSAQLPHSSPVHLFLSSMVNHKLSIMWRLFWWKIRLASILKPGNPIKASLKTLLKIWTQVLISWIANVMFFFTLNFKDM